MLLHNSAMQQGHNGKSAAKNKQSCLGEEQKQFQALADGDGKAGGDGNGQR